MLPAEMIINSDRLRGVVSLNSQSETEGWLLGDTALIQHHEARLMIQHDTVVVIKYYMTHAGHD